MDLPFAMEEVVGIYMTLAMGVIGAVLPKPLELLARATVPYYALMDRVGVDTSLLNKSVARGFHLLHQDWNVVNERRTQLRWKCRELFKSIDVLLCPAVPVPAFPHQTKGNIMSRSLSVNGAKRPYMDHVPWISLAPTALLPATCAPVGTTPEGLPVGVQIIGPAFGDRTTIRFAELLAEVRGGFQPPPLS